MSRRLNLTVDEDVAGMLIELAGGEKKQGAYLNQLVRRIYHGGDLLARVSRLEAQVASLLEKSQETEGGLPE